jgi:hypothetical protein
VANKKPADVPQPPSTQSTELLRELVAHLREHRTQLREEWASSITEAQLLTAMTKDEIFAEATSVYDNYVEALATGTFEALQTYADRFGPTVFSLPRNAASGYEGTQAAAVVRQPCKSHTRRLSRI